MSQFLKNNWQVIVLFILSFTAHFFMLNYPARVVFDEVHFGQYVEAYFSHQYYFDIHPPLGKLMIFGFSKLFGFTGNINFSGIGNVVDGGSIILLRFLPALFGSLFVLLIYFLILKMKLSKRAAFLGACLVLFENSLLLQSRLVLMDIFQICFGFASLYFLICYKNVQHPSKKKYGFLISAAVFSALAFSIKWTGLSFLAVILLYLCIEAFRKFDAKKIIINLLIVTVIPFAIYYAVFAVHFSLLYKPGDGDAYMSRSFQKLLPENANPVSVATWDKFIELNQKMYFYNSTLTATHPYSSKWYQWPLDERPIWYLEENAGDASANIWFIGNPIIWWSVLFAAIVSVLILLFYRLRKKIPDDFYLLFFGYALNYLTFIFIGRTSFIYYYLPSLIFGILMIAVLYDKILSPMAVNNNGGGFLGFPSRDNFIFYVLYLLFVILAFLFLLPVTYGIPLSPALSHYFGSFVRLFL